MSKELKTGIISIIIVVTSFWGFNFMKGQDIFQPNTRIFKVEYKNVGGLTTSSLVTINGLIVGKVKDIYFNPKPEKRGELVVEFLVDNDFEFTRNSIVKISSPNPLANSNLAIIPNYEGDLAVSGDYLRGEMESGLFTSIGERLNPIQQKLERVLVDSDTLFTKINNILDERTSKSIQQSIIGLEATINDVRGTLTNVNSLLDSSSVDIRSTLANANKISGDLSKVTDTLANARLGEVIRKTENTLNSLNAMLENIEEGKGTFGKMINDDEMYNSLTNASKELEELLREMKLNPKRFVHFSLFGKRAKPYNKENNQENKTNQ